MKSKYNKISVVLILLTLVYVIYLTYISTNNLLVGATISENKQGEIKIKDVEDFTMAYYAGVQKGDIVKNINGQNVKSINIQMNKLKNVNSMVVDRNGHDIEIKLNLFNDRNFSTYLIPIIFYVVCLFCCFFIIKINEEKKLEICFGANCISFVCFNRIYQCWRIGKRRFA